MTELRIPKLFLWFSRLCLVFTVLIALVSLIEWMVLGSTHNAQHPLRFYILLWTEFRFEAIVVTVLGTLVVATWLHEAYLLITHHTSKSNSQ